MGNQMGRVGAICIALAILGQSVRAQTYHTIGHRSATGYELKHVSGQELARPNAATAGAEGTTYSVHHRLSADSGGGPVDPECFFIFDPALPGAPDDTVTFDGVTEPIRTDLLGTVPVVTESILETNDTIFIDVTTSSIRGADLFPAGFVHPTTGAPLTNGCFAIGLDDLLDSPDHGKVLFAALILEADTFGVVFDFFKPEEIFGDAKWDGFFQILLTGKFGAGSGIHSVTFEIVLEKNTSVPAASEWGVVVMALLLLAGAKIYFGRRTPANS